MVLYFSQFQLDLITDLLGTPKPEDIRSACSGARNHMLKKPHKAAALAALYTLSPQATPEAIHLLCQMLVFDPERRITIEEALNHPYIDEGRLRYHSCMCKCCRTTSSGLRTYAADLEPVAECPFDDRWEKKITSMSQVKEDLYNLVLEHAQNSRTPLCINPHSAAFKSFTRYSFFEYGFQ